MLAYIKLAIVGLAVFIPMALRTGGELPPRLQFIQHNFTYSKATHLHHINGDMVDSIKQQQGFLNVFLGTDTLTIKQTLGEPDLNWIYTYRYFFDNCCYELNKPECTFNCHCLTLRISPQGHCTSVKLGAYIKTE